MRRITTFRLAVPFFIGLFVVTALVSHEACAVSFLDGKMNVSGFLRNDSAWRLQKGENAQEGLEKGDYVLCRNTLQLEIAYKVTDWLNLFLMPRFVYEGSLDLDRSLEKRIVDFRRGEYKYDNTVREVFADLTLKNTRFRFGKQQIMWGETDLFRMADVINPLDVSWDYLLYSSVSSFEDIRIPLWALDVLWSQTTGYQWALEFLWLPGCIENGFEPFKVAPEGANWNLPGQPQFFVDSINTSEPGRSIKNSEFGLRVKGVFAGWDVAGFYLYSRMRSPTPRENILNLLIGSISPNPKYGPSAQIAPGVPLYFGTGDYFLYPFTNRVGMTFNKYQDSTKFIWRGECMLNFDEPLTDKSIVALTFTHPEFYERNTFQYFLGFDRPTMIPILNPNRSFLFSFQFFQRFIINHNDNIYDHHPGGCQSASDQTVMSLLINTGYRYDTIAPQLLLAYNFVGEGYVNPQVEKWLSQNWRIGIGAQFLLSHSDNKPYFGQLRSNDQVYGWLKYQFD